MTEAEIKETVFKALKRVAPEAKPETLGPDQDVRQTLDIDSYDFLMFLLSLDEALGVDVPEADYGLLISLTDITRYLAARVRA
ncbi:MAG: acyl carrier protein [Anaerolineae bacterium]|nr:acyl carrier protein [Anaerolineae bacterium]